MVVLQIIMPHLYVTVDLRFPWSVFVALAILLVEFDDQANEHRDNFL